MCIRDSLSELGRGMACRVADHLRDHDITVVIASPLERAQETAAPIAQAHGLPIRADERVIEASNDFEGSSFSPMSLLRLPVLRRMINPWRPSWGEPYDAIAQRMLAAVDDAR